MLWKEEEGYSMAFWAIFIAIVAVPLMALTWDASRYMDLRGELQMAADSAAVAAAQEVDIALFERTGVVRLGAGAIPAAYAFAAPHFARLREMGYHPSVTYVQVDQQTKTVHVGVSGAMHIFFPSITPAVGVSADGMAQVRMRAGPGHGMP